MTVEDVINLHPNWRQLHLNHIAHLEMMVKDNGPQYTEAARLLLEARQEFSDIEGSVMDFENQGYDSREWIV